MEYQNNGVSGRATAGLTTGIIGTALGVLNGGGLGILGNGYRSEGQQYVTKDELEYTQTISSKDCEIALLKAESDSEKKMIDVFERLSARIQADEKEQNAWNTQQMVNNAQMASSIAVNSNSIAALQNCCSSLTKLVIPADNVCPKPMPLLNSWTAPTNTSSGSGTN